MVISFKNNFLESRDQCRDPGIKCNPEIPGLKIQIGTAKPNEI